ncbi:MAG: hypothetical protein WA949_02765 [Phormidesmis sp.]
MLSKLFFQKIIPIVACAISCNAFSALESKAERFSGFASVELRDYQISIPSGYYEFRVSSPNGDPTGVFFTADMEELGFSSTYGSEILKGNLAEGTYVLRIATESCSAWLSNCDADWPDEWQ